MSVSIYKNGWTREKVLEQIKDKNGFTRCVNPDPDLLDSVKACLYRNSQGRACLFYPPLDPG